MRCQAGSANGGMLINGGTSIMSRMRSGNCCRLVQQCFDSPVS
jgi:hypothetical protein